MNAFIQKYLERLKCIRSDADIAELYRWFWRNQKSYAHTIDAINKELGLTGLFKLKKDLPCISVGGTKGVLLVSANPGWDAKLNARENACYQKTPENYVELMQRFFVRHPQVVHKKITWWARAISSIRLLEDWQDSFGDVTSAERWIRADETRLIGGWEMFPFHSQKDGLTSKIDDYDWLKECAKESIRAALRLKPQILFTASKQGARLLHELLPANHAAREINIGTGSSSVSLKYLKHSATTEIISVSYQIFSARRNFTNDELFYAVRKMRGSCRRSKR